MTKKTHDLKSVEAEPLKLKFRFSNDIPKFWFNDSPAKTHVLNALTLLLPAGEK